MNQPKRTFTFHEVPKMTDAEAAEFVKNNPAKAAEVNAKIEEWKKQYPAAFTK